MRDRRGAGQRPELGAQTGDPAGIGGDLSEVVRANKPWTGPYPAGARAAFDASYGDAGREKLDLYLPAERSRSAPVVVMVHGGGWRHGDKAFAPVVRNKVERWLARGVAVASVNYPMLSDGADPRAQARAVGKALAWLDKNAGALGIDMGRAALMGHSAGAHLALLVSSDPELARAAGFYGSLRAIVALDSGAVDVSALMSSPHPKLFDDAFGADPAGWARVSPMARLSAAPAPTLLVCSSLRRASCAQGEGYAAKARSLGGQVAILPMALSHLEVNDSLGLPGAYTEAVEAFLERAGVFVATEK